MVMIWYKLMGVNAWHQVKADLSCNECSELAKGMLRAKKGMGVHPNVSTGPEQTSSESRLFMIEHSKRVKGELRV